MSESQGGGFSGGSPSFLPTEYVRSRTEARANVIALLLFGAVLIGVVSAFFMNNSRWESVREQQAAIDAAYEQEAIKIDQLRSLERQRGEMLSSAEVVTALIERVPRSVLLAEVLREMPNDLILTEVRLDGERVRSRPAAPAQNQGGSTRGLSDRGGRGGPQAQEQRVLPPTFSHTLALTGLAQLNNDIADYLATLKASPLLTSVELQYINETVVDERQLRRFRINMRLRQDADARQVRGVEEKSLRMERDGRVLGSVPARGGE